MGKNIVLPQESFNIIGAAMEVHKIIGCGFTEVIYQEALEEEIKIRNIPYSREKTFPVTYKGKQLSKYFRPDFVCYDKVIVELKAVSEFTDEHFSQVLNYLKAHFFFWIRKAFSYPLLTMCSCVYTPYSILCL